MSIVVRHLGRAEYLPTVAAMRAFTETRNADTPDELWLCEHPPVYTQGLAGKAEHILLPGDIPVVHTNRGGQVTYHGPGQVVAYPLIHLQRAKLFVKGYVYRLEEAVLRTLRHWNITGHRVAAAPGIYVRLADPHAHAALTGPAPGGDPFAGLGKICALGIKVHRHCAYHGLALNVAMDLQPYSRIHPCGYAGLQTVDFSTIGVPAHPADVAPVLSQHLCALLS